MEFPELRRAVEEWSSERGIDKAEPSKQMLKLTEEVGELAASIARDNIIEFADAIGDIMVVLTILCQQLKLDLHTCYLCAYQTIKNRKGKTVNGVFVKDSDIPPRPTDMLYIPASDVNSLHNGSPTFNSVSMGRVDNPPGADSIR